VVYANSQIFSTSTGSLYLRGSDGNVHIDSGGASLWVNSNIWIGGTAGIAGRSYVGNWDGGQAFNVGGHILASGYIFNRGSTNYRCWDNADFTYSPGIVGNTLVQRDGAGNIQAANVYMPSGAQGGRPAFVVGQTGDGWLRWWPANAIGPPSGVVGLSVGFSNVAPQGRWQRACTINLDRGGQWVVFVNGRIEGSVGAGSINTDCCSTAAWSAISGRRTWQRLWRSVVRRNVRRRPNVLSARIVGCARRLERVQPDQNAGGLYAYFLSTQDFPN
jgi:hypothetical protein